MSDERPGDPLPEPVDGRPRRDTALYGVIGVAAGFVIGAVAAGITSLSGLALMGVLGSISGGLFTETRVVWIQAALLAVLTLVAFRAIGSQRVPLVRGAVIGFAVGSLLSTLCWGAIGLAA